MTGLNSTRVCESVYRTNQEVGVAMNDVYGLLGVLCISVPVENVTIDQNQVVTIYHWLSVIYNIPLVVSHLQYTIGCQSFTIYHWLSAIYNIPLS